MPWKMRKFWITGLLCFLVAAGLSAHAFYFSLNDAELFAGLGCAGLGGLLWLVGFGALIERGLGIRTWPGRLRERRRLRTEAAARAREARRVELAAAQVRETERRESIKEKWAEAAVDERERDEDWRSRVLDRGGQIPVGANRLSHDIFIHPTGKRSVAVNMVMAPIHYLFMGPVFLIWRGMINELRRWVIVLICAAFLSLLVGGANRWTMFGVCVGAFHVWHAFIMPLRIRISYRERGWTHIEADRY